ncbi:SET and MYND domain-containing protein 4-like [Anopheles moucheti]|uniref:SET and MYND domain-containing protein 4-like n=1 Tax=Anopheles moucheti TaxID=186751 RepID=UPI0022EFFA47|nr:SET and MYND domain-containing protein 4-like [Anopheles moucheti]
MSRALKEPDCDVKQLFDSLWDEEIAYGLANASMSNQQAKSVFFTREIRHYLRDFPYRELLALHSDVKNNAKADELRNLGNYMFHPRVKRYIEAVKYYNESITYSEKGSEQRALAYGNRSLICLELRQYEDCLKNIRLARDSNYPERLAEKLKKREKDAKLALEKASKKVPKGPSRRTHEQAERQLKLSYGAHENMPQVAKCLQLQRNDQFGRHVVTNHRLNVGDVVMIDKPFVTVLDDLLRYVRCAYCYEEKIFTLIPCEGCTLAMYCSEQCLSKAYQQYHRYECAIIRDMWRISGDVPVVAIRAIALAVAAFDHDVQALKEHLNGLNEAGINAFSMDWKAATPKDIYDAVYVLTTNQQLRRRKDLAFTIFFATIVHQLVLERTELGSICAVDTNTTKLLFDLILRHLQIAKCNRQWLCFMDYKMEQSLNDSEGYATGCFPLIGMMNHSCAPNVKRITLRDGRCAIVVIRPIAGGGQLFDNYERHHLKNDLEDRQTVLLNMFNFRCGCEACMNDYPTLEELPHRGIPFENMLHGYMIHKELESHDVKKAIKYMSVLGACLKKKANKYPEFELCHSQVQFERCFLILYSYTSKLPKFWKYCNP